MSENKRVVEQYMEGFRKTDHAQILACLTDDVTWEIPGFTSLRGKEAFDREIENENFTGRPLITVHRMTEENDVVIAEGSVRTQKKTGEVMQLAFCDVFEMRAGLIAKLVSYLVEVK